MSKLLSTTPKQWLLLLVWASCSVPASATRVTVDVRNADGSRAGAGVEVAVTENGVLTANPPSGTTDRQSRVRFDNIAEGQVIITASSNGVQGTWTGRIRGNNQNVRLTLEPGIVAVPPEPAPAPSEPAPTPTAPSVTMQINDNAPCTAVPQVRLNDTVSGPAPSEYRASESSSFSGSAWQAYTRNAAFALSAAAGRKRVYYQVRSRVDGSLLQSPVASDDIDLVVSNTTASLSINGGARTTLSRSVTLNNAVSFNAGGTNPRYIASERSDFSGAEWQPYTSTPQFMLSEGSGTKTVYFLATREVCGRVIGTQIVSDNIDLAVATAVDVNVSVAEPTGESGANTVFEFLSFNAIAPLQRTAPELFNSTPTPLEAIQFAESQGFSHRETRIAGQGTCKRASSRDMIKEAMFFIASPAVARTTNILVNALICEYSVFGGRRLNRGWSISNIRLNLFGHRFGDGKWVGNASVVNGPSGDNANMLIRINVPAYQCGVGFGLELCPITRGFTPEEFGGDWAQGAYIDAFRLEGPSSDWRDAFRR